MDNFFQLTSLPTNELLGTYDPRLVVLSFMVASAASYIALDLTGRLRDINNTTTSRLLWWSGGAVAMGSGIWSMHFIGMLSFTIPGLTLRYDLFWTALSLVVAIIASGFALFLLQASKIRIEHYIAGGILLGLAIASMHYTGMEAMLITLNIRYLPMLFFLSILIAIVASETALWLALKSNKVILKMRNRVKLVSAVIMGVAISGMHYTAMAASVFTPLCLTCGTSNATALDPTLLAIGIAGVTFVILGIAFFASSYREALNQQQFERARQLGMQEISASVLHSVGNVLNSVNVSSATVSEKISTSKLDGLGKLCTLLNEHEHHLAEFISQDPRGSKTLNFLNKLAEYWTEEQKNVADEMKRLNQNLKLIQNIISTQQNLSKTTELEQIILLNDAIDETLLITGLQQKKEIDVSTDYAKIHPIKIDKVKLMQILVNLIRNAKDAVLESEKTNKRIKVKTSIINNNKIRIEIIDNGIGILPKNLIKIFNYGFTTKTTGHGFGLHMSAISLEQLGGEIKAQSEGFEKGAAFIIELPYTKVQ